MVEGGPDCCCNVQWVHTGRWVCSGRQALVQFAVAKARLKSDYAFDSRGETGGGIPHRKSLMKTDDDISPTRSYHRRPIRGWKA
jgi:hypothetical protein